MRPGARRARRRAGARGSALGSASSPPARRRPRMARGARRVRRGAPALVVLPRGHPAAGHSDARRRLRRASRAGRLERARGARGPALLRRLRRGRRRSSASSPAALRRSSALPRPGLTLAAKRRAVRRARARRAPRSSRSTACARRSRRSRAAASAARRARAWSRSCCRTCPATAPPPWLGPDGPRAPRRPRAHRRLQSRRARGRGAGGAAAGAGASARRAGRLSGEARAARASGSRARRAALPPGTVLLAGGETVVRLGRRARPRRAQPRARARRRPDWATARTAPCSRRARTASTAARGRGRLRGRGHARAGPAARARRRGRAAPPRHARLLRALGDLLRDRTDRRQRFAVRARGAGVRAELGASARRSHTVHGRAPELSGTRRRASPAPSGDWSIQARIVVAGGRDGHGQRVARPQHADVETDGSPRSSSRRASRDVGPVARRVSVRAGSSRGFKARRSTSAVRGEVGVQSTVHGTA